MKTTIRALLLAVVCLLTSVQVKAQFTGTYEETQQSTWGDKGVDFKFTEVAAALQTDKWRDFTLIGAFVVSYLVVIASSGFSNSERFLLPGLPCLILIWAYGIATLREKTFKLLNPWCIVVVLMEVAWAYFKLGSRGLF